MGHSVYTYFIYILYILWITWFVLYGGGGASKRCDIVFINSLYHIWRTNHNSSTFFCISISFLHNLSLIKLFASLILIIINRSAIQWMFLWKPQKRLSGRTTKKRTFLRLFLRNLQTFMDLFGSRSLCIIIIILIINR